MEGPKQVLHMKGCSHINAAEANENQRNWTKEQYDRRNDQGEKFYDWYRRHLNFEIDREGNIHHLGYSGKINERFDSRCNELGAEPLDLRLQEKYLPNRIVKFIISGDTEVMRKMAFGNQDVNFLYESESNSRVKRMKDIEKWAKSVHSFICKKYGAENVVGFDVHLDEHSPHIHCSIIPVGQRLNKKTGNEEPVISFKQHFGHSLAEGSLVYQALHTELYKEVNRNFGLVRGDSIHGRNVKHRDRTEYNRFLARKEASLRTMIANAEQELADLKVQMSDIETAIRQGTGNVDKLKDDFADLEKRYKELKAKRDERLYELFKIDNERAQRNAELEKQESKCNELEAREKDLMDQMTALVQMPLADAALKFILPAFQALCLEAPEIREHLADTIFEDIDQDDFPGIMKTAAEVFIAGILGPEYPVQISCGGGGSESKMPWKDEDEDIRDYALRCLKFGRKLYKSSKKTQRSGSYHRH
ncbi:MAG: MobV family relaxase [Bacteroidales bacterium]|nr:MobV family relaxase [Bacteroidales bacterium]